MQTDQQQEQAMSPSQWQEYQQWLKANSLSHSRGNWNRFISDAVLKLIADGKLIRNADGSLSAI